MKRILSIMLVLVLLTLPVSASAAGGLIDESIPDFQRLILDVAVEKDEDLSFYASVDGSEMVEIDASAYPADSIGHIIVVDLAWGWTSHVDEATVIRPILNDYLGQLDRDSLVKFIIASPSGTTVTPQYMSVSQANLYVNNSLALPEKATGRAMSTGIAAALQAAYKEATTFNGDGPAFKTVFALVDPANSRIEDAATSIRDEYRRSGNSFPVSIVTVYVESYMEKYDNTESAKRVRTGMQFYQDFANSNGTILVRLNHRQGETIKTHGMAAVLTPRAYYRLNLSALHPLIDYTLNEHEIVIEGYTRRGSALQTTFSNIKTQMLPPALHTPAPEITSVPEITPEPPVVSYNDNSLEAKQAIRRLQELYYLDTDKKALPSEFDDECQYAFLTFCTINGVEEQDVIYAAEYELLMSSNAIPNPTATPIPVVEVTSTPAPTEVPFIYTGTSSIPASRLIDILKRLYYLDSNERYNVWDNQCMLALMEMCAASGIPFDEEKESVDEELYKWIISDDTKLVPKPTSTPEPVSTPVPTPTIPPEGYKLGDVDPDGSSFIAQMQTILQSLNLYSSDKVVGQVDQATMDAVILYCQQYGMSMSSNFQIDKGIVSDILTNGGDRSPYVAPVPSFSEKFATFLQKDALTLGNFQVKMWMLIALVTVLVFVIILICILSHHKKVDQISVSIPHVPVTQQQQQPQQYMPSTNASMTGDETVPLGSSSRNIDDDMTVPLGSGVNVTLTISDGSSQRVVHALIGSKNYIIGRETSHGAECDLPLARDTHVSRKHVALYYKNGQLFIHNLCSIPENAASVNGRSLDVKQASADMDMTVPLNGAGQQTSGAFALKRGDVIEICRYRIRIEW